MFFSDRQKPNRFFTLIIQTLIIITGLSITAPEVESFPLENLKQEIKDLRNKQLPNIGKFKLVYDTSTQYKPLQQIFRETRIFESVVVKLNQKNLNLPVNIPIIFTDCDEPNAFYSPKDKQVLMCYEIFEYMSQEFVKGGFSSEEALERSIFSGIFILHHEVGHALVDVLQLAITGKEEDSVDDFAAIMSIDSSNNNATEEIVLSASLFFSSLPDSYHWDEHSFGQQRFYNLVCLLLGKNPQKYINLAQKAGLGESRARRCPGEYQQKVSSWQRLLAPHSINDLGTPATNTGRPLY